MEKFKLGNDVYLVFKVMVNKSPAIISSVNGKLYRGGDFLANFMVSNSQNTVSGVIPEDTFHSVGDYIALFEVGISSMGMREHAIPFKITKSVLGKRRQ